ncbi:MAG: hypothetical protein NT062_30005, partial [Proteobacteria bacterium]|nr:hypothetical protein [Pseudomonadota bacterium]
MTADVAICAAGAGTEFLGRSLDRVFETPSDLKNRPDLTFRDLRRVSDGDRMSNGNGPGRPRCRGVPHAAPTEHSELVARTKCLLDSLRAIRRGHGVTIANLAAAIAQRAGRADEVPARLPSRDPPGARRDDRQPRGRDRNVNLPALRDGAGPGSAVDPDLLPVGALPRARPRVDHEHRLDRGAASMNAATVMLGVIGHGRGVVRLEAVDGARVADVLKLRVHGLGERAVRITAIGHGIATCSTYAIAPWDLGDLISFVELRALEPAPTHPVVPATVRPSSHTTGGVALVVDAAGYLAIGSPLTGELVVRRADGVNLLARVGVVTSIFDTARHRSVIRVEIDLGL